jgi:hypothetical protein
VATALAVALVVELARDVTAVALPVRVAVAEGTRDEAVAVGVANSARHSLTPCAGMLTPLTLPENTPVSLPQLVERARMVWSVEFEAPDELANEGNWEDTELQEGASLVFWAQRS